MTTTTSKTGRILNRASKGGEISPVNGQFYLGGQFLPTVAVVVEVKPAPLVGSSRQVMWATRLRSQALGRLAVEIATRRLFLNDAKVIDEAGVRSAIRRDEAARYGLMVERSASKIIGMRTELVF